MKKVFFIWLCIFFSFSSIRAQESPPIQIFSSEDYGAEIQNWSISQSENSFIYVANNKGLLEFNGASWQLYPSPNETIIRSVSVIDDLVYTGCNGDFGFWKRNEYGQLFYTSLSQILGINFLDDEEFWNIVSMGDYILFQSLKRIYIYNKKKDSYSVIESDTIIYKIYKIGTTIYFQKTDDGLYKIEKGKAKLVSNHSIIQNNRLPNVFLKEGKLLVETENNGFYILDNENLTKWDIEANKRLSDISVFRSIKLKDGSFILGTRSNGILHLTVDGKIDYSIDAIHGLSNNTVHAIFEDAENNIWLALENGINCINVKSPFSIYKDDKGKIGTVYASKVFNGSLYLGTNQGLFYRKLNSNDEDFNIVEGIQDAVWCLVEIDNTLFCGHDTGTSIVNNYKTEKIKQTQQGTWNIKPLPKHDDLLLQGSYDGLSILQKINDIWVLRNKIKDINMSSKFFEVYDNHIFISHEYKGVYKIKLDNNFTKALTVEKDTIIKKEINSSLIKYNDALLFASKQGIFKYDLSIGAFAKDTILSSLIKEEAYTSGRLIYIEKTNTLWNFSENNLNYISRSKLSNGLKINTFSFSKYLPRGLTGYENISYLKEEKYLIGTSSGYIVVDLEKAHKESYHVTINSVQKHGINTTPKNLNRSTKKVLDNKENNLIFTYSVAEFEKYLDTEYQYQLVGIHPDWSQWSTSSTALFKNLPFGDYVFNVRAKVGNTLSKNVASYSFKIERPWFLSNLLLASYILIVLLFSLFMHNIYKRYYKKQRERLLLKKERELELKEMENKQQFMRFNNDKLRQDIENKNRELGISTMSLIKKNEFLNSLKKELLKAEDKKHIKNVIRIIDRNLNDTDDWHTFEEAFNNADKDFLKTIKKEHPSLTSNDLRLCAYLRLNLSSKEIAPLLNISPRSVEVKRYRLRKKMNLPHESSLTDYILEI